MVTVLTWALSGFAAGWLARFVIGSRREFGIVGDLILGSLGGLVGGWFLKHAGVTTPDNGMAHVLVAVSGAAALVGGVRLLRGMLAAGTAVLPTPGTLDLDLEKQVRLLGDLERRVLSRVLRRKPGVDDPNRVFDDQLTFGQRVADHVATFGGSWTFIGLFLLGLVVWMIVNEEMARPFDAYPFILLNLVLSCVAALQAPVIMMSQNRMAVKDRIDARSDYEVNMRAEMEIMGLHAKLDAVREREWTEFLNLQRGCFSRQKASPRMTARAPLVVFVALVVFVPACAVNPRPIASPPITVRESSTSVMLQGKPLDLHLSAPQGPAAGDVLVLYASGDGGWFGAAVDMFHRVGRAGYYTVGFSAKAFLKLDRPKSSVVSPGDIMQEYQQILAQARAAMHIAPDTPAILTGWSRGAAFAVLAGSERGAAPNLGGVIAIGLSDGEDLEINGPADETDDGTATRRLRKWPFEPYSRIAQLGETPCAVIQASGDNYLAASRARDLFGPDTPTRRFYAIDARNHRFSGGKAAFDQAFLDAIEWMISIHRSLHTLETSTGVGR